MHLDRSFADHELFGDGTIAAPAGHQPGDLSLARRQREGLRKVSGDGWTNKVILELSTDARLAFGLTERLLQLVRDTWAYHCGLDPRSSRPRDDIYLDSCPTFRRRSHPRARARDLSEKARACRSHSALRFRHGGDVTENARHGDPVASDQP